jgi:hypothetical protein
VGMMMVLDDSEMVGSVLFSKSSSRGPQGIHQLVAPQHTTGLDILLST